MESPYGVYADIMKGQENAFVPRNLELMRQADLAWVRCDFYWDTVENPPGTWHFDHIEKVLDQTEARGLKLLVILGYTVPWARPVCDDPEPWLEYVRRTVSHFKDRVKHWEIWNEQNLKHFWVADPDPKAYAQFLKITYETIKKIDPAAVVVYGGLAGVPFDYYEKTLQAGAGRYLDVMNIHPYRGGLSTAQEIRRFLSDLRRFHDLTVKYCGEDKPLWITEMGWSTPPALGRHSGVLIDAALARLFPQGVPGKIAVIYDPLYPPSSCLSTEVWRKILRTSAELEAVRIADLKTLDPAKFPVLILPPTESFPTDAQDEIRAYVRDGGTLAALGGIPFYYRMTVGPDGVWTRGDDNSATGLSLAQTFRVHWYAWWTQEGTPRRPQSAIAPGLETLLKDYPAEKLKGQAFFAQKLLKQGDSLEPLLVYAEDSTKAIAGIYRFRSDWKGNIILNTIEDSMGCSNRTLEPNQGIYLSQAILLAVSFGVDRFFPYEFQAVEHDAVDPEHHFGIVHADLTPKPGYLAYRALTKARPAGSVNQPGELFAADGKLCTISWKRPDGQAAYAIWSPADPVTKNVGISGELTDAFDCHGSEVKVCDRMTFSQKITYFIFRSDEQGKEPALRVESGAAQQPAPPPDAFVLLSNANKPKEIVGKILYADNTLRSDLTDGTYRAEKRSGGGSDGNAYTTIQAAISAMEAGDVLLLRGGTFKERNVRLLRNGKSGDVLKGTPEKWFTVQSYPGEWAVVDGGHHEETIDGKRIVFSVFHQSGAGERFPAYWRFAYFEVTGGGPALVGPDGKVRTHADIQPIGGNGFFLWPGRHIVFDHLYVHGNYGGSGPNGGAGIKIMNENGGAQDILVTHCRLRDNGWPGEKNQNLQNIVFFTDYAWGNFPKIDIGRAAVRNEVRYCLLEDSAVGIKYKGTQYLCLNHEGTDMTAKDAGDRLHHNIVRDCGRGLLFCQDFGQAYNNIVVGCDVGIEIGSPPATGYRELFHVAVYNNTTIDCKTNIVQWKGWSEKACNYRTPPFHPHFHAWNNIVVNAASEASADRAPLAILPTYTKPVEIDFKTVHVENTLFAGRSPEQPTIRAGSASYSVADAMKAGWGKWLWTCPDAAALFSGKQDAAAWKTRGDFVISAAVGDRPAVTVGNGGKGGDHPYLPRVRIPDYVGAVPSGKCSGAAWDPAKADPDDAGWVDYVLGLERLGATIRSPAKAWVSQVKNGQ
ncbi:MAG: hypothetical protein GX575_33720 [Candidatus Anammoximicrobium sp.]|nr:hypothetical protein [Candidatus Anammoximicrobium sp.]